jgi:hypothetical protein
MKVVTGHRDLGALRLPDQRGAQLGELDREVGRGGAVGVRAGRGCQEGRLVAAAPAYGDDLAGTQPVGARDSRAFGLAWFIFMTSMELASTLG